jgi:hypothetical protein
MKRQSKRKGVVNNSEVLSAFGTNVWRADSKKFKIQFFCNNVLSHWVFAVQCLDQLPSKTRTVDGLETLYNKHPIRGHNIQENRFLICITLEARKITQ